MGRAYNRGHKVHYDYEKEEWLYSDDNTPITDDRPCARCGCYPTSKGHDYCLSNLGDKVKAACCGHGVEPGYILLEDGRIFYAEDCSFNGFKIKYERDDEKHIIGIDHWHRSMVTSSVEFIGDNKDFEVNLRNMQKVCDLLNDMERI